MKKNIDIIINTSEITAGTRGASMGPDAIITAARAKGSMLFGQHPITRIANANHLLDHETRHNFAKRLDGLVGIYKELNEVVSKSLVAGNFPLILAGDHGSAGGTIAGVKSAFPDKRVGVVWIDAHADIHSPYTTPSGNIHGMPLATALNDDNLPCRKNDVPYETITLWEELKNTGGIAPKIQPQDLIYVAVRDVEKEEVKIMERLGIKNYGVEDLHMVGEDLLAEKILERLSDCDVIYISFDVDSMDPLATSHGTGTPVENGLLPSQAEHLMLKILESGKVVCLEFVEVNPCLDEKTNKMAETALKILESLLEKI
ncbi:MAG: Arginase [Crocinitomicaceae bacterium]|jgi:arginase|nr:Arginase [Crocinitomicaceae bacterium]